MLPKDASIFVSYHPNDEAAVSFACEKIKAAGWGNTVMTGGDGSPNRSQNNETSVVSVMIEKSGMVLVFLSKAFALDDRLMLEEFAYAAVILRKPFLPVWLDSLEDIQAALVEGECPRKPQENMCQLLSALEMLTAKHTGTSVEGLVGALEPFSLDQPEYKPSEPKICVAPCEAYEGDSPYIFISYAHDDAPKVYPIVESLFTAGWDVWYDEGIKPTQRYLPVIADHIKRSAVFVLMLTERCLERPFVMNYELAFARKLGIPVLLVLLEDVERPGFFETAVQKQELLNHIAACKKLPNHGTRPAVPPAIKQNMVYDVAPPPQIEGFETKAYEGGIAIAKYVGQATDVVIPGTATTPDGTEYKITRIDNSAFSGCKLLKSITLSKGITSIGESAFYECGYLINITMPKSITSIEENAFQGCSALTYIMIPEGVTSIEKSVFCWCKSLTSILIPKSVTSIGDYAFKDCKSLLNITLPDGVTSIGANAFSWCISLINITLPKGLINIGDYAFDYCTWLASITIPEGVVNIGNGAFRECRSLNSINVDVANNVYANKEGVLFDKDITRLLCCPVGRKNQRYVIPEGVTSIDKYAFRGCKLLTSITIPEGVACIGEGAFSGCESLTNITLPQSIASIGKNTFFECESLTGITIPEGVTCIGKSAFALCTSLTSITLPEGIICISQLTFASCRSLTSIILPESLTSIGESAFIWCKSLRNIVIPEGVKYIEEGAFWECPVYIAGRGSLNDVNPDIIPLLGFHIRPLNPNNNPKSLALPELPCCAETPYALVCCEKEDTDAIRRMLITLYWEGFSIRYEEMPSQTAMEECACVLAFFTEHTESSVSAMGTLEYMNKKDKSRIVQVFPEAPIELPDAIKHNLQALQGIPHACSPGQEAVAWGKIRESLRGFKCCVGHPRGFQVKDRGGSVEIEKFTPTGFPHVIIPKTFFNPPMPVTSIGADTFSGCTSLTSISIPESVSSICEGVFRGCNSLTSITLPENITNIDKSIFYECTSLISIAIPKNVTNINEWAFFGCKSLTSVTLPESVTHIGDSAFRACESLTRITIPKNVTSIGEWAFLHCKSLTSITIPEGVTNIGKHAFGNCISLPSINVDAVNNMYASKDGVLFDKNITRLVCYPAGNKTLNYFIPEGVTSIGESAFEDCASLTSITIPKGVTSIGESAFEKCKSLARIDMAGAIINIGDYAFQWCTSLTNIILSEGVTSIGKSAFRCCKLLVSITLPKSLTSIGKEAFQWCTSLTNITLPEGLTSIGFSAFESCTLLASITIPGSVTYIDAIVFRNCKLLTLYCPRDSVAWRYAEENGIRHETLPEDGK